MTATPRWQRGVIQAERTLAPRLGDILTREEFAITVGLVRTACGALNRTAERWSSGVLHLFNLPAATDIRALRAAVASLEHEVSRVTPAAPNPDGARPRTRKAPRADAR